MVAEVSAMARTVPDPGLGSRAGGSLTGAGPGGDRPAGSPGGPASSAPAEGAERRSRAEANRSQARRAGASPTTTGHGRRRRGRADRAVEGAAALRRWHRPPHEPAPGLPARRPARRPSVAVHHPAAGRTRPGRWRRRPRRRGAGEGGRVEVDRGRGGPGRRRCRRTRRGGDEPPEYAIVDAVRLLRDLRATDATARTDLSR